MAALATSRTNRYQLGRSAIGGEPETSPAAARSDLQDIVNAIQRLRMRLACLEGYTFAGQRLGEKMRDITPEPEQQPEDGDRKLERTGNIVCLPGPFSVTMAMIRGQERLSFHHTPYTPLGNWRVFSAPGLPNLLMSHPTVLIAVWFAVISAHFSGEGSLGSYRFYLLSLQNKIGDARYLNARDDTDALAKAHAAFTVSAEFPAIEVWRGTRIVGRVLRPSRGA